MKLIIAIILCLLLASCAAPREPITLQPIATPVPGIVNSQAIDK